MQDPVRQDKPLRAELKSRKQEVDRCLVAFDLQAAGWLSRRQNIADHELDYSRRLCQALVSLGPVFSAFGRYLSSRIDLSSVPHCAELAAIPDQGEVTPRGMVREILQKELNGSPFHLFSVFDLDPFESRLLLQSHRAALKNGVAVTATISHPAVQSQFACDVALLPGLKHIFVPHGDKQMLVEEAVEDFCRTLRWQFNLSNSAQAFEALAEDAQTFKMLRVPHVYRELSTSNILTLETLSGLTFETLLMSIDGKQSASQAESATALVQKAGRSPRYWMRLLCHVWLRQALLGRQFPIEFQSRDVLLLPNKQIAFTGGILTTLAANTQKHLWDYIVAASTEEPDQACSSLLQEVTDGWQKLDEDELQYRFREIVPFRDSDWLTGSINDTLIQHLFVHWRLLSDRGLHVSASLLCFYRGLYHTAAAVESIPDHDDPFLDGFKTIRTTLVGAQFKEMLELDQLRSTLEMYATLMLEMPQKLDRALTVVSETISQRPRQRGPETRRFKQQNISAAFTTVLLVLAAVVLLVHHLESQGVMSSWLNIVSTIVFLVLGGLLFRITGRTR